MNFLSKNFCILCDGLTDRSIDLCFSCEKELPFLNNYCKSCGKPLVDGQKKCGFCLSNFFLDINLIALFNYCSPIDKLIIDFKFKNNLVAAKVLGDLLGKHLCDNFYQNKNKPEIIIPVPLHKSRIRERGYNQALELSRSISKKLNIKVDKLSVRRIKETLPQVELSAKDRKDNVKKAFRINMKDFKYSYVAIVDDVITTGNTINELCKALKRCGVKKIDVWSIAKSEFGVPNL